jgi:DNA-binding GntR family transcriptional regulator
MGLLKQFICHPRVVTCIQASIDMAWTGPALVHSKIASVSSALPRQTGAAAREHRQLLAVCLERERRKAAALLGNHILSAGQALILVLEKKRGVKDTMAEAK